MSLAKMPSTYKKTINAYLKLFSYIGIEFLDNSTSYLNWTKIKLTIFCCIFVPFVIGQLSLLSKITAENFLETVQVVPLDIMFCNVFLMYGLGNLAIYEVFPLMMSCYYMFTGDNVYMFPFQPTNSWAHDSHLTFFVTYLWQIMGTVPCQICLYLPFDLTIATMTSNVSGLLRLLQEDLKRSINIYEEDHTLNKKIHVTDPKSYERVQKLVYVHQRLLRVADKLTDIFGIVVFIHVATSSIEICFFGFLAVVYGGFVATIINIATVMSAVFTIFILSPCGRSLCDTSTEVANAAYQSLWYESDKNVRKMILFIIIRSQKPSYLSALGFSQLTLTSFSKIMSTSWSYFSLLFQMYEDS